LVHTLPEDGDSSTRSTHSVHTEAEHLDHDEYDLDPLPHPLGFSPIPRFQDPKCQRGHCHGQYGPITRHAREPHGPRRYQSVSDRRHGPNRRARPASPSYCKHIRHF
jgi:hypothetical protein